MTCSRQKPELLHHAKIITHSGVLGNQPTVNAVDVNIFDGYVFSCRNDEMKDQFPL